MSIKTKLKALKNGASALEKKVINVLLDQEDIEIYINDLMQHGCQSGMVGELISYNDTIAFFNKYKKDILDLLEETMKEYGASSPAKIFGKNWDDEDYFIREQHNQNLLAWFGFEETVRKIAYELELDI